MLLVIPETMYQVMNNVYLRHSIVLVNRQNTSIYLSEKCDDERIDVERKLSDDYRLQSSLIAHNLISHLQV